jgi:AraC-like DNA-binding protein
MRSELSSKLPMLAELNAYRTSDLDAARCHIAGLFVPHELDVIGRNQILDVCIGRAQVEGISLLYHRHGASVRVRPQPLRDFFLLQIPIHGEAYVRIDGEEVFCSPRQAVMISPDSGVDMRFGRGCEQLIVRVDKLEIERHLEQQLGRHITTPLAFAPAVPLTTPPAQEITSLLRFMIASLTSGEGISSTPLARKHMSLLLLSGLLSCLDHNYREEVHDDPDRMRPAYLTRARRYMMQNIDQPIGPDDIAAAAHVSARALFAGFKIYLNTTPMRYLKELRLDMVRESLLQAEPHRASITSIAMNHGFHHLGHFCEDYQERFSELPRDTLNRALSSRAGSADRRGGLQVK